MIFCFLFFKSFSNNLIIRRIRLTRYDCNERSKKYVAQVAFFSLFESTPWHVWFDEATSYVNWNKSKHQTTWHMFFFNTVDLYSHQFFVTIQIFNADWTQKQTKVIRHNLFVQFITHLMPPVKCFNIYCFATRLFLRI